MGRPAGRGGRAFQGGGGAPGHLLQDRFRLRGADVLQRLDGPQAAKFLVVGDERPRMFQDGVEPALHFLGRRTLPGLAQLRGDHVGDQAQLGGRPLPRGEVVAVEFADEAGNVLRLGVGDGLQVLADERQGGFRVQHHRPHRLKCLGGVLVGEVGPKPADLLGSQFFLGRRFLGWRTTTPSPLLVYDDRSRRWVRMRSDHGSNVPQEYGAIARRGGDVLAGWRKGMASVVPRVSDQGPQVLAGVRVPERRPFPLVVTTSPRVGGAFPEAAVVVGDEKAAIRREGWPALQREIDLHLKKPFAAHEVPYLDERETLFARADGDESPAVSGKAGEVISFFQLDLSRLSPSGHIPEEVWTSTAPRTKLRSSGVKGTKYGSPWLISGSAPLRFPEAVSQHIVFGCLPKGGCMNLPGSNSLGSGSISTLCVKSVCPSGDNTSLLLHPSLHGILMPIS